VSTFSRIATLFYHVVWEEEIAEAKSSLTFVKEVKLLSVTHGLKSPREDLTPGKNQRQKPTSAELLYSEVQSTTNKMQHFTIYFCKTHYMFRTAFPSIIRSSKLHIQRQVFVRPILLPAASLARLAPGSSFGLYCIG